MEFTSPLQTYLNKVDKTVSLSIKITNSCVNTYTFTQKQFENILEYWNQPGGAKFNTDNGSWIVQHKKRGPRPICEPANFVRIDFWRDEQSFHYRVDYKDMIEVTKDYFYQKQNTMHWDKNV